MVEDTPSWLLADNRPPYLRHLIAGDRGSLPVWAVEGDPLCAWQVKPGEGDRYQWAPTGEKAVEYLDGPP